MIGTSVSRVLRVVADRLNASFSAMAVSVSRCWPAFRTTLTTPACSSSNSSARRIDSQSAVTVRLFTESPTFTVWATPSTRTEYSMPAAAAPLKVTVLICSCWLPAATTGVVPSDTTPPATVCVPRNTTSALATRKLTFCVCAVSVSVRSVSLKLAVSRVPTKGCCNVAASTPASYAADSPATMASPSASSTDAQSPVTPPAPICTL